MKTLIDEFEDILRAERVSKLPPGYEPPRPYRVERPDTPEEIKALRERFWELMNEYEKAQHHPSSKDQRSLPGDNPSED